MRLLQLLAFAIILFSASCKKGSTVSTENFYIAFKATLNGASETPANASVATGLSSVSYNKSTKLLSINITYSGLTITGAHIHKGAKGVDGPPVVTFDTMKFNGAAQGCVNVDKALMSEIAMNPNM